MDGRSLARTSDKHKGLKTLGLVGESREASVEKLRTRFPERFCVFFSKVFPVKTRGDHVTTLSSDEWVQHLPPQDHGSLLLLCAGVQWGCEPCALLLLPSCFSCMSFQIIPSVTQLWVCVKYHALQ